MDRMAYPPHVNRIPEDYQDCAVAERQAQVREALDQQERALGYLTEHLQQLDSRLQCACRPAPPSASPEKSKLAEPLCDLALRIDSFAGRTRELAEWISSLNHRLEL